MPLRQVKWDLLEIIRHNSENWEIDKGEESGINYEYDCSKSFVETYIFNKHIKLELQFKFEL